MTIGGEKPSLIELVHFGVKGMRWGVIRDDAGRSTESKSLRKQSARTVQDYMWTAVMNDPMFASIKKEEYEALSKRGESFAKNTTLRRISTSNETAMKGATFVSKMRADADFYRAVLPAVGPQVKGLGGGGKKKYKADNYEFEMQTLKKLTLPSAKVRFDAFMEVLAEPSIKIAGKDAPVTGRKFLEDRGYKKLFGKQTDQELAFLAWHDFVKGQGSKDLAINEAYWNKLRSKGYNALRDDNDSGRYTKNPLILLDADKTVKIKSIKRLTADDINQAQRRLANRMDDKRREIIL